MACVLRADNNKARPLADRVCVVKRCVHTGKCFGVAFGFLPASGCGGGGGAVRRMAGALTVVRGTAEPAREAVGKHAWELNC